MNNFISAFHSTNDHIPTPQPLPWAPQPDGPNKLASSPPHSQKSDLGPDYKSPGVEGSAVEVVDNTAVVALAGVEADTELIGSYCSSYASRK